MPRAIHIARGHCCEAMPQCVECPYEGARQAPLPVKARLASKPNKALVECMIKAAGGDKIIYYSDRPSLKPVVIIGENLTIIYQEIK